MEITDRQPTYVLQINYIAKLVSCKYPNYILKFSLQLQLFFKSPEWLQPSSNNFNEKYITDLKIQIIYWYFYKFENTHIEELDL